MADTGPRLRNRGAMSLGLMLRGRAMVFLGVVLRQNKIKSMRKIYSNIIFIGRISQYFASKKYTMIAP
jgi:uncharacterized membrane protein